MAENQENMTVKKENLFIVRLNWSDLIALTGVLFSLISILHSHFGRFENAIAFMFVAMLINSLDGAFVKLLKAERLFGRYMDGFIEFLVYLIAPAVFFYYFGFERLHIVWILLLFGACGIVRLSVYDQIGDVKTGQKEIARLGMPVFWSHFIAAAFYGLAFLIKSDLVVYLAAAVMLAYSFLMILNRRFAQFDTKPHVLVIIVCLMSLFLWLGMSKGSPLF
jgi:CDP-diacylglycerol--serine O-phosphatidyltransferase